MGLVLCFVLLVFFLYLFQWLFMILPIAVLYILMRHFTSKDPWLIEILLDSILENDIFIP